ncbi:MAG: hypothetical protein M1817_000739 [Caeruleum heppii]|nr:MAG: hypothetical protein M1817_000739 [Caeruleum heppii]
MNDTMKELPVGSLGAFIFPENTPEKMPGDGIASSEKRNDSPSVDAVESSPQYPTGWILSLIIVALLLSMFLVALDMTIVATAIPRITEDFHSLDDVGWYGSAFFLTLAAFQSPWGKGYKYFSLKTTFFASVSVFEVGSLICAVAKNSLTLIVGRAITGAGGAGVTGGCYVIIAYIVPPAKAPAFLGLIGAVFSCASVAGPLLGGLFTNTISWRWCFYINLPVGGAALLILLFFFRNPPSAKPVKAGWKETVLQMDVPGLVAILASLICYVLALGWAGTTKPWNSAEVIGTLTGWVALTIVFIAIQWKQKERALLVLRILKQRNIAACCTFIFLLNSANLLLVYYLPIYFQAIKGSSPAESGVQNLPLILAVSIFVLASGWLVGRIKYFQPFLFVGGAITTVGAGLLYTLDLDSSTAAYVGYQVIVGVGVGTSIQIPVIAAQALSDLVDLPCVTAIILFFQLGSGAMSVSAAQAIFANRLIANLPIYAPGLNPADVLAIGATELRHEYAGAELQGILQSYMGGLKDAWAMSIGLAGLSVLASLWPELKRIQGTAGAGAA